jgi:hypothetical protein
MEPAVPLSFARCMPIASRTRALRRSLLRGRCPSARPYVNEVQDQK